MNGDVSLYALAEEARLSAGMDDFWPPIPNPLFMVDRHPEQLGAAPARIRAAFEAYPDGLDMAWLLFLTGLSWDAAYPLIDKALRVGRLRLYQRQPFTSQGQPVSGKLVYHLQDVQRRTA